MKTLVRRALGATAAASALLLASCMNFSQDIWINKDGSGRMVLDIGMSKQMIEMAKNFGEQGADAKDPFDTAAQKKEIEANENVKSVKVTEKEVGEYKHFIYDIEVKDVTKLDEMQKGVLENGPAGGGGGGEGPENEIKVQKLANGNYKVTAEIKGDDADEGIDESALAMAKQMFGDNALTIRVHGPPVKHNGKLEGDAAVWSLKLIDMATGAKVDVEAEVKP